MAKKKKDAVPDPVREMARIKKETGIPHITEAQLTTFNSKYVDSMDEVHAVLDDDTLPNDTDELSTDLKLRT